MKRPRDTQRSKVYAAEDAVFNKTATPKPVTFNEMKWEIRKMMTAIGLVKELRLGDGRGRLSACGTYGTSFILLKFPRWSREPWIYCHELAHATTSKKYSAHGPEFCRTYFELVKKFIGPKEAGQLMRSFAKHKVKVAPKDERWSDSCYGYGLLFN